MSPFPPSWSTEYTSLTPDNNTRSVSRRPDLNFTVIVNPSSGPGSSPYPDAHYDAAIRRLNSHPNIETVGYVRTGYATRNLSDVKAEVAVYSGWFSNASALAMHGIFFDEAPHEYSAEAVEFLRAADSFVKSAPGLQGRKTVRLSLSSSSSSSSSADPAPTDVSAHTRLSRSSTTPA